MTVRLPVSASWMGEDTSVEGPCHVCTPPSSKIRLPLTCGFVSGPTVIDLARGRQSSSRSARLGATRMLPKKLAQGDSRPTDLE